MQRHRTAPVDGKNNAVRPFGRNIGELQNVAGSGRRTVGEPLGPARGLLEDEEPGLHPLEAYDIRNVADGNTRITVEAGGLHQHEDERGGSEGDGGEEGATVR